MWFLNSTPPLKIFKATCLTQRKAKPSGDSREKARGWVRQGISLVSRKGSKGNGNRFVAQRGNDVDG